MGKAIRNSIAAFKLNSYTSVFSAIYFDIYLGAHNVRVPEENRTIVRATEKYINPNWSSATLAGKY